MAPVLPRFSQLFFFFLPSCIYVSGFEYTIYGNYFVTGIVLVVGEDYVFEKNVPGEILRILVRAASECIFRLSVDVFSLFFREKKQNSIPEHIVMRIIYTSGV